MKISGWYFPGERSDAIILVHGIHNNRAEMIHEAQILAEAGYHLLLIDMRGHGFSQDSVNSYGYREALDVQAAVDYLLARPEINQVGAIGRSLGGSTVVRAAAIDPRLSAIVVESSFSSLSQAVNDAYDDMSFFPKWPFAPLFIALAEYRIGIDINQVNSMRDLATIYPRPVLIIHGTHDNLFPLYHAQNMYSAAKEPKELWVIKGLGHRDPVQGHEEEYATRVILFFEDAFSIMPRTIKTTKKDQHQDKISGNR